MWKGMLCQVVGIRSYVDVVSIDVFVMSLVYAHHAVYVASCSPIMHSSCSDVVSGMSHDHTVYLSVPRNLLSSECLASPM